MKINQEVEVIGRFVPETYGMDLVSGKYFKGESEIISPGSFPEWSVKGIIESIDEIKKIAYVKFKECYTSQPIPFDDIIILK